MAAAEASELVAATEGRDAAADLLAETERELFAAGGLQAAYAVAEAGLAPWEVLKELLAASW